MTGLPIHRARQRGVTLLEVLVTILVMSVGLLGLAGLTAASIRNNHGAYHRSQAVWLAHDMADRMRANRHAAQLGQYSIALGAPAPAGSATHQVDLQQWTAAIAQRLPNGRGEIFYREQIIGGMVSLGWITIQWDDTRATGGVATQQFRLSITI